MAGVAAFGWQSPASGSGGGGAPTDATYITQTPNGSLSAEQALSTLATGLLKSTTTTGVVSIAVAGTDYLVTAAPVDAQYLALAANATLTVERVFTPSTGLTAVDSGAGAAYTLTNDLSTGKGTAQTASGGVSSGTLSLRGHAALSAAENVTVTTTGTNAKLTGSGTEIVLESTGNGNGTSRLHVGASGINAGFIIEDLGLDLVDLVFLGSVHNRFIRMEGRAGSVVITGTTTGEFQMGGANFAMSAVASYSNVPFIMNGGASSGTVVATTKLSIDASVSQNSGASVLWNGVNFKASTATLVGATNVTTATGFNFVVVQQPTITSASTLTVTSAATVYIADAPVGAGVGPVTITNKYSLWVDAGLARFDGNGTNVWELPADATGNITAASGRVPILIGGALKYFRYFDS